MIATFKEKLEKFVKNLKERFFTTTTIFVFLVTSLFEVRKTNLPLVTLEILLLLIFLSTFYYDISEKDFRVSLFKAHFSSNLEQENNSVLQKTMSSREKNSASSYEIYSQKLKTSLAKNYSDIVYNLSFYNNHSSSSWELLSLESMSKLDRNYKNRRNFYTGCNNQSRDRDLSIDTAILNFSSNSNAEINFLDSN